MKHFVVVLSLVLMLVFARGSAFGCTIVTSEFPSAYRTARAVFVGEVVKIDKPLTSETDAPLRDRLHKITFKVEFSWKGAGFREFGFPEFVVLSQQGEGGDCFSWGVFLEGKKYLVYADETLEKDLIVGVGNRTDLLSKAAADLTELRRLDFPFSSRFKQTLR